MKKVRVILSLLLSATLALPLLIPSLSFAKSAGPDRKRDKYWYNVESELYRNSVDTVYFMLPDDQSSDPMAWKKDSQGRAVCKLIPQHSVTYTLEGRGGNPEYNKIDDNDDNNNNYKKYFKISPSGAADLILTELERDMDIHESSKVEKLLASILNMLFGIVVKKGTGFNIIWNALQNVTRKQTIEQFAKDADGMLLADVDFFVKYPFKIARKTIGSFSLDCTYPDHIYEPGNSMVPGESFPIIDIEGNYSDGGTLRHIPFPALAHTVIPPEMYYTGEPQKLTNEGLQFYVKSANNTFSNADDKMLELVTNEEHTLPGKYEDTISLVNSNDTEKVEWEIKPYNHVDKIELEKDVFVTNNAEECTPAIKSIVCNGVEVNPDLFEMTGDLSATEEGDYTISLKPKEEHREGFVIGPDAFPEEGAPIEWHIRKNAITKVELDSDSVLYDREEHMPKLIAAWINGEDGRKLTDEELAGCTLTLEDSADHGQTEAGEYTIKVTLPKELDETGIASYTGKWSIKPVSIARVELNGLPEGETLAFTWDGQEHAPSSYRVFAENGLELFPEDTVVDGKEYKREYEISNDALGGRWNREQKEIGEYRVCAQFVKNNNIVLWSKAEAKWRIDPIAPIDRIVIDKDKFYMDMDEGPYQPKILGVYAGEQLIPENTVSPIDGSPVKAYTISAANGADFKPVNGIGEYVVNVSGIKENGYVGGAYAGWKVIQGQPAEAGKPTIVLKPTSPVYMWDKTYLGNGRPQGGVVQVLENDGKVITLPGSFRWLDDVQGQMKKQMLPEDRNTAKVYFELDTKDEELNKKYGYLNDITTHLVTTIPVRVESDTFIYVRPNSINPVTPRPDRQLIPGTRLGDYTLEDAEVICCSSTKYRNGFNLVPKYGSVEWDEPDTIIEIGENYYPIRFIPKDEYSQFHEYYCKLKTVVTGVEPEIVSPPNDVEITPEQKISDIKLTGGIALSKDGFGVHNINGTYSLDTADSGYLEPGEYDLPVIFKPTDEGYTQYAPRTTVHVTVLGEETEAETEEPEETGESEAEDESASDSGEEPSDSEERTEETQEEKAEEPAQPREAPEEEAEQVYPEHDEGIPKEEDTAQEDISELKEAVDEVMDAVDEVLDAVDEITNEDVGQTTNEVTQTVPETEFEAAKPPESAPVAPAADEGEPLAPNPADVPVSEPEDIPDEGLSANVGRHVPVLPFMYGRTRPIYLKAALPGSAGFPLQFMKRVA